MHHSDDSNPYRAPPRGYRGRAARPIKGLAHRYPGGRQRARSRAAFLAEDGGKNCHRFTYTHPPTFSVIRGYHESG